MATGITIEDITSETAAKVSADAASTSYSNAQFQAGQAANSASAASGSANTASIKAGEAAGSASAASGSAATASERASAASSSATLPVFAGQPYTLSADSVYVMNAGGGHCYTEIVWFDGAGNWISQNSGTAHGAGHDFSTTNSNRLIHKLTVSAPGGATTAIARLVHYKTDGSSVNTAGWRQVKFEAGDQMTAYSNEASVTTINEALTSTDGKANQALARAGVQLDVNGYVSGWEIASNGQTSDFTVSADRFRILKPGGGPRTEYRNGYWIATDGGSYMSVWGAPFGPGNRFLRWTGPYFADLNSCQESNAREYLRVDGSLYFGGALLAGTLRNSNATSVLAPNASTSVGPFGSNGGQIVVNAGWTWNSEDTASFPATAQGRSNYDSAIANLQANGYSIQGDGPGGHTGYKTDNRDASSFALYLSRNGGQVASEGGCSGSISIQALRPEPADGQPGYIRYTYLYSKSLTWTDPDRATWARTFVATIQRNFTPSGSGSQRVSVNTVE